MELKQYQRNTLDILKRFFEQCRIVGPAAAFKNITTEPEIAARLAGFKNGYTAWDAIPNTPRVCLKVHTGGGKTILAACAVKTVSQTWCEKEHPLVLWFVPSDTIRRQTAEALKNSRIPTAKPLTGSLREKSACLTLTRNTIFAPPILRITPASSFQQSSPL